MQLLNTETFAYADSELFWFIWNHQHVKLLIYSLIWFMTPYPESSLVPLAPQVLCLFWHIPPCWHATLKWWKWCAGKCKWSPTPRYNHRKCENSCGTSSAGLSQQCFAQVVFLPCIWLLIFKLSKGLIACFPKASPLCLFYQNLTSGVLDMMPILRIWWNMTFG